MGRHGGYSSRRGPKAPPLPVQFMKYTAYIRIRPDRPGGPAPPGSPGRTKKSFEMPLFNVYMFVKKNKYDKIIKLNLKALKKCPYFGYGSLFLR